MVRHPLVRRLLSPAGLVLVGLCFLLPFVAVSCQGPQFNITVEYTGTDLLVGGAPSVSVTGDQVPDQGAEEQTDDPIDVQPTAILALVAILAGIGLAALSTHRQRLLGGLVAGAATVLLLVANQITVESWLSRRVEEEFAATQPPGSDPVDLVHTRPGFLLALLLALAVTGYNGIEYLRQRRQARTTAASAPGGVVPSDGLPGGMRPLGD